MADFQDLFGDYGSFENLNPFENIDVRTYWSVASEHESSNRLTAVRTSEDSGTYVVMSTDNITGTTGRSPFITNERSTTRRLKDLLYFYGDFYEEAGRPSEKLEYQNICLCLQHKPLIDLIDMDQGKIGPRYLHCTWWRWNREAEENDPVAYEPLELLIIVLSLLGLTVRATFDDLLGTGNDNYDFLDDQRRLQAYQELLHLKIRSSVCLDLTQIVSGDSQKK